MNLKKRVAKILVTMLHSEQEARDAEDNFASTFQKKEIPDEMDEIKGESGALLSEVLVKHKVLPSKSEWRRLVAGGAVHDLVKNENITDVDLKLTLDLTLKIGKKKFIKILVN